MINKLNTVPANIQQMAEVVLDSKQPPHVRHNYAQSLDNIKDVCERVVDVWNKESAKLANRKRK